MLTADQISALRDRSEQLLDPVINFLIEDITRRVKEAGQLTGTATYQTWQLQKLGMSQRQLKKEIAKRLEISLADAEKLLTQAAETGYNFDLSRFPNTQAIPLSANSSLQQILEATVDQARADLTNMTQTMGFVGADGICRPLTQAYQQACDFAFQKISTGAQDYVSAIRDATWGLAEKGIRTIDYKSGYHISIEAAVRQNMMGGMGIMQNHIAQNNHDTLGCNGWEISAHENSAPDHEPIQGKQYSDAEYEALNNSLARRIGTLHCGHYASPIILGVHSPQYTDEELEDMRRRNEEGVTFDGRHYTGFEATQRQRKFERSIRKQQRRILIDEVAEDAAKLQTDQIRLQRLKQEYKRFSEGVDLPMQYERLDTAGFTWKHAKAAQNIEKLANRTNNVESGRIAKQQRAIVEKETLQRMLDGSVTIGKPYIEPEEIDSDTFGHKFSKLTQNSNINDRIRSLARGNLTKNNGTYTETIDILDLDTGESIIHKRGKKNAIEVLLDEKERAKVRNHGGRIIGMHNHPTNIIPTGSDFVAAASRGYEFGIVVTHDLRVFQYTGPKRKVEIKTLDKIIEFHTRLCYTDDDKRVGFEKAVAEMEERFGITWKEIM